MSFEQVISFSLDDGTPFTADPIFADTLVRLGPLVQRLSAEIEEGSASYLRLPFERSDLKAMRTAAERIQQDFTDVVVLGAGGSSLGAQALYGLVEDDTAASSRYPKLHFPDNLNAHSMATLLSKIDFGTAHFLAISKSGSTVETLAQLALCLSGASAALVESEIREHFSIIVGPGDSPLRRLAEGRKFTVIDHLDDLCGRFSVFSQVGLLPAMIAGLDPIAIRSGASELIESLKNLDDPLDARPAQAAAALDYFVRQHGIRMTVLMPYETRLEPFSRWYQQLWSESLGKGGQGTTPLRALGPADQHSLLQLFLDGPADKFLTTIEANSAGLGPKVEARIASDFGFDYLADRTIGDVVAAGAKATIQRLIERKRPVREIRLPGLKEQVLGELMMSFMIETVLTAGLMGVNAFDQPAVEEGKRLTVEFLETLGSGAAATPKIAKS